MLLHYLFILGICVEAVTGALSAGRKKMDFFGVMLIACITALGGGTVRDVLLNTYPLTWVSHPEYLLYTTISALLTIVVARSLIRVMKVFLILDALGLSTFVIVGILKALNHGLSPAIAVLSGMITGICGGMLRDILCNDIPLVLRKELYAVIALGGALLFMLMHYFAINEHVNIIISFLFIFCMRLLAIFFHLQIPVFDYSERVNPK
ncbi:MAG: hypothetical protein BGO90_07365 [Legionella sp. 40-6]|nr:trimeric intracellular cation channel family protein [Legionella sp.]OJY38911.1 MAG: hypothetical protein BGO90_07365 [Legionella sp. 40-6]